jgi:hypothetical protein
MSDVMYRSVLHPIVQRDDVWMEGYNPSFVESGFVQGQYNQDPVVSIAPYDVCPCKFENDDVHIEKHRSSFMHRNSKDTSLTVSPSVFDVNPQDPKRQTYIESDEYTRYTSKLQHFYHGVQNRMETLNGKRKATAVVPSSVSGTPAEVSYNESDPLRSVNINVQPGPNRNLDVLSNYPQIVQFTLDTMKSTPAGVPGSGTGPTGGQLTQQANDSYTNSVNRYMPREQ